MSSAPWYPRNPVDFTTSGDVLGMELDELGAYSALLDHQWMLGGLPDDEPKLRELCKKPQARTWARIWGKLERLFPVDEDGCRRNPRLEKDREKLGVQSESQRAKARKRWGVRPDATIETASKPVQTDRKQESRRDPNFDPKSAETPDPADAGAVPGQCDVRRETLEEQRVSGRARVSEPPADPTGPWWRIPPRDFGAWWDQATEAYMPDGYQLGLLRESIEGWLKPRKEPLDAAGVEAFARGTCAAVLVLANEWTKHWKPVGCTPQLGVRNMVIVQKLLRGEIKPDDLKQVRSSTGGGRAGWTPPPSSAGLANKPYVDTRPKVAAPPPADFRALLKRPDTAEEEP